MEAREILRTSRSLCDERDTTKCLRSISVNVVLTELQGVSVAATPVSNLLLL